MLTRHRCGAWIKLTFGAGSRRPRAAARLDLVGEIKNQIKMLG